MTPTRMVSDIDLGISCYALAVGIALAIVSIMVWSRHRDERFARTVCALMSVAAGSTSIVFPSTLYSWSHHALQPTFSLNLIGIARLFFTTMELLVVLFVLVPEDRG